MTVAVAWGFVQKWVGENYIPLAIGAVIAWVVLSAFGPEPAETIATADCTQYIEEVATLKGQLQAKTSFTGGVEIGEGVPRPSTQEGCPDCPACPKIKVSFAGTASAGGEASGTASSKVTNTARAMASVVSPRPALALSLGAGSQVDDLEAWNVGIALEYKDLRGEYQYDRDKHHRIEAWWTLFRL